MYQWYNNSEILCRLVTHWGGRGRGHFGYTCSAIIKKGELKGQKVVVKVIPKAKVSSSPLCLVLNVMKCICILNYLQCLILEVHVGKNLSILWVHFLLSNFCWGFRFVPFQQPQSNQFLLNTKQKLVENKKESLLLNMDS